MIETWLGNFRDIILRALSQAPLPPFRLNHHETRDHHDMAAGADTQHVAVAVLEVNVLTQIFHHEVAGHEVERNDADLDHFCIE